MTRFERGFSLLVLSSLTALTCSSQATTYYVAPGGNDGNTGLDWGQAVLTVARGLEKATTGGDTVLVSNGTYNVTATVMVTNPVTLQSFGSATNTIIQRSSGTIRVMVVSNAAAVVDGFTIRNGSAPNDVSISGGPANGAAGIWIFDGTVRNCIIRDNQGVGANMAAGGGVILFAGRLQNSTIVSNLISSTNGREQGGGVFMLGTNLVENCVIEYNACLGNEGLTTQDGGGGVWMNGGGGTLRNCLIAGNSIAFGGWGGYGGGVRIQSGTMEHCTVTRNKTQSGYGGVYNNGSVRNCIVYGNQAYINPQDLSNGGTVSNTCSSDGQPGSGNLMADPQFADPGVGYGLSLLGGDFHLRIGSPCIDAGTNGVTTDLDGTTRPVDGNGDGSAQVDPGCYEAPAVTTGALRCSIGVSPVSGVPPLNVALTASVAGAATNHLLYAWDFMDDGTDDLTGADKAVATNLYPALGSFAVKLTVTNGVETAVSVLTNSINVLPGTTYVTTNGPHTYPFDTWAKAATNIQAAIDAVAGTNAQVWVSNGTYTVGSKIGLAKAVRVTGVNGSSNTVIRPAGAQRLLHLSHAQAVFEGFTIRDATATIGDFNNYGSTVSIAPGAWIDSGTLQNCVVVNNGALQAHMAMAGGVYMTGGRLCGCTVVSNWVSSGNGREEGGGICVNGTGIVERCGILYNETRNNGYASQDGGAGVWMNGGMVKNCLIAGSQTHCTSLNQQGAGVRMEGGIMLNCTVARNYSASSIGGIYRGGGGTLTNCIVAQNLAVVVPNDYSGSSNAFFSDSPGFIGGPGNIVAPPQFKLDGTGYGTNLLGGDFHLSVGSPCIDTGTNLVSMTNDLDNAPRQQPGNGDGRLITDMGCYEVPDPSLGPLACDFSSSNTAWSAPFDAVFTATAVGNTTGVSYAWDFTDDGFDDVWGPDRRTVTNTYSTIGYYTVKLTVTNAVGGMATAIRTNFIRVAPSTAYAGVGGNNAFPYDSWARAASNIQDAVNAVAGTNQAVVVSNGSYNVVGGPLSLDHKITVRSTGGAAVTVLTGAGVSHVVYILSSGSVLDGFGITGGQDTVGDVANPNGLIAGGGGIWMLDGTVQNCSVYSNSAFYAHMAAGGGVYMNGGRLFKCSVFGNYVNSGNGREQGGGICAYGTSIVENCSITCNQTVNNGYASLDGGGGLWMGDTVVARNCLIAGNQTHLNNANHRGGGVRMQGGSLQNCTVAQNQAAATEGGVYVGGGSVINCIIFSNSAGSGANDISPTTAVSYSCSPDLSAGTGNLGVDPLFKTPGSGTGTNAVLGDFRLGPGSPCMNAGTNLSWMTGTYDLGGLDRVVHATVDMGAYESRQMGLVLTIH